MSALAGQGPKFEVSRDLQRPATLGEYSKVCFWIIYLAYQSGMHLHAMKIKDLLYSCRMLQYTDVGHINLRRLNWSYKLVALEFFGVCVVGTCFWKTFIDVLFNSANCWFSSILTVDIYIQRFANSFLQVWFNVFLLLQRHRDNQTLDVDVAQEAGRYHRGCSMGSELGFNCFNMSMFLAEKTLPTKTSGKPPQTLENKKKTVFCLSRL